MVGIFSIRIHPVTNLFCPRQHIQNGRISAHRATRRHSDIDLAQKVVVTVIVRIGVDSQLIIGQHALIPYFKRINVLGLLGLQIANHQLPPVFQRGIVTR